MTIQDGKPDFDDSSDNFNKWSDKKFCEFMQFAYGAGLAGDAYNSVAAIQMWLDSEKSWDAEEKPLTWSWIRQNQALSYEGYLEEYKKVYKDRTLKVSDPEDIFQFNELIKKINQEIGEGVNNKEQAKKIRSLINDLSNLLGPKEIRGLSEPNLTTTDISKEFIDSARIIFQDARNAYLSFGQRLFGKDPKKEITEYALERRSENELVVKNFDEYLEGLYHGNSQHIDKMNRLIIVSGEEGTEMKKYFNETIARIAEILDKPDLTLLTDEDIKEMQDLMDELDNRCRKCVLKI